MPRRKEKSTFQSYVKSDDGDSVSSMDITDMKLEDCFIQESDEAKPDLLPGEIVASQVSGVLKFLAYSGWTQGLSGWLICTNYKMSFITTQGHLGESLFHQKNKLLGENDIALCNISDVYQVSKSKRKHLTAGGSIVGKVKNLEIHCKDFSIHCFSFKFADQVEAKNMAQAIVHHSFPTRLELLFAFEYKADFEPDTSSNATPRYRKASDWEKELMRLNVHGYKATMCNPGFRMSHSLPECIIVPGNLTNSELGQAVPQFIQYRAPTWSYTHRNGASLLRMSHLMLETSQTHWERKMLDAIKISHPLQRPPRVYDLMLVMPSFKEIQTSYERLCELCMPVSKKEIYETESSWLSELDSTQWLQRVAKCLEWSVKISDILRKRNESVVLKEMEGRDLTALVSCIIQILLDPHCRTTYGFQCLVEREFVALGHRFTTRCGLLPGSQQEKSPIFLLFLDCVWQLLQQFPSAFEFSTIYLTTLWDSVCMGMFENFIFNSERERQQAAKGVGPYLGRGSHGRIGHKLMSVWDWHHQYQADDLSLHKNPLYLTRTRLHLQLGASNGVMMNGATPSTSKSQNDHHRTLTDGQRQQLNSLYARKLGGVYMVPQAPQSDILRPVFSSPMMRFWESMYLRWVTPLTIAGGGSPLEYLHQCIMVEEIICLQGKLDSLENQTPFSMKNRRKSDLIFSFQSPSSALPDRDRARLLTSSFPFSPGGTPYSQVSFCGTPLRLNRFMENSLLVDSDTDQSDDDLNNS